MALTPTEEAQIRQLIAENPALLSLAAVESTILSKLGATKVNLSDLTAATSLSDADIALVRQGLNDKSFAMSVLLDYVTTNFPSASTTTQGKVELATNTETQTGTDSTRAVTPASLSHRISNTFDNIVVFDTPGVSSWTVPTELSSGTRKAIVTVVAGGAGGASGPSGNRGSGGSAGGAAIKLADLTGETSISVTVGSGGAGGTGGGSSSPGTSSSFGSMVSCTGASASTSVAGGNSGSGTGGDINIGGGNGSDGSANGGSGDGGPSIFGGNGRGGVSGGSIETNGKAPGAGGGGAGNGGLGGSGADGIVIIEW